MIPPAHPDLIAVMGGSAGRFRRGIRQLRNARSSWQLTRILVYFQGIPVIWNLFLPYGPDKLQQAQKLFGLNLEEILQGRIWQTLTYGLIHGNWGHLLINCAAILIFGSKLEQLISHRSFWLLTLYSVVAGGLCFLLGENFSESAGIPPILVGSSAICFSFLLFMTTLSPDSRFLPLFTSGSMIGTAVMASTLLLALMNPNLPTGILADWGEQIEDKGFPTLFNMGHSCHFGGALVGLLYGKWLLRPRVSLESLKRARERKEKRT